MDIIYKENYLELNIYKVNIKNIIDLKFKLFNIIDSYNFNNVILKVNKINYKEKELVKKLINEYYKRYNKKIILLNN